MIKGIYGFNIAVKDLDAAVKHFENVFDVKAEPMGERDFAFPGLKGAKLDINGTIITLLSSSDENTAVAKFLKNKGEGVFLVSVEVDDMDNDVKQLANKGLNFVLKESKAGDFGKVNFVHPKSAHGVQLEIYQPKR